jgi:hypothetical protein
VEDQLEKAHSLLVEVEEAWTKAVVEALVKTNAMGGDRCQILYIGPPLTYVC